MIDTERYLERINFAGPVDTNLETLERLQRAHMTAVPFENLHVVSSIAVRTDTAWSVTKIVDQRRGGWCFENNGAFSALLMALGFEVLRLGAAVLLGGPNKMIDHLCLEVMLDEPYLVDVGFGESFIKPLALNQKGPQDGGTAQFEFIDSAQGTTLAQHIDGVPDARYRFKRVGHDLSDFDSASEYLSSDPTLHWSAKPFATRLLEGGPDRVTLLKDRLKITRGGQTTETEVAPNEWAAALYEWFHLAMPVE